MAAQLSAQNNEFSFEIVREMQLQFDNETAYPYALGSTFQYCEDTDEIVYLNRITQTLKYYDYKTGKQTRETKLQLMGPNNVGQSPILCALSFTRLNFCISRGQQLQPLFNKL